AGRYDMLESVREYGRARFDERRDGEGALDAHRAYFAALAEQARDGLMSRDHRSWHRALELDYGNVRAAFEHAVARRDWDDALRTATGVGWFWRSTDRLDQGRTWIDVVEAVPEGEVDPFRYEEALTVLCYLAGQQHETERAVAAGEDAMTRARARGD